MNPTLAVIDSAQPDRRIRLSLRTAGGGIQLTNESFSADVGWYVQSSMDLEPDQVAALRGLLGQSERKRNSQGAERQRDSASQPRLSIHRAS